MPDLVSPWLSLPALFGAGLAAGTLNVLAGGGSFLTLPVLIFLGLPPTTANGTNRIGILTQNVGAVWAFHRHRVLPWGWTLSAAVPAAIGAVLGTWAALVVGDEPFQKILAFLMVAVTLWSLLDPPRRWARGRRQPETDPDRMPRAPTGGARAGFVVGFFAVGVYGGFVQAGAGFFILAVTSMAGLDLVRGNALKVLTVLVFTVLSLTLFAWQGHVAWVPGIVLGAGSFLGGQMGVRLTVLKGHRWVRGVVTVAVVAFAVKLWWDAS